MRHLALAIVLLAVNSSGLFGQGPAPGGANIPLPPGGITGPRAPGMPPRDQASQPTGSAVLRGRVTRADTGQPLRRVQVRATASELREGRVAITDDEGRYELDQLPAGRYLLNATKGGYVSLQFGQRRPFDGGQPIQLADGQVVEKIDFALPRGGVISGRVVDEFGEPLSGLQVQATRHRYVSGRRQLVMMHGGQTDDRGDFRLFGIAPGEYYVSASLPLNVMSIMASSRDHLGYASTYYPGTPIVAEAQRVMVGLGEEVSGITFALSPARTASVSGIARGSDGRPLAGGTIMVTPRAEDGGVMFGGIGANTIRPDGSFTVSGLAPGNYTLQARSPAAMIGTAAEVATAEVTVNGSDLTGVVLSVQRGGTVHGRVRFDDGSTPINPAQVQIMALAPVNTPLLLPSFPATVADDWTFEIKGVGGQRYLRVNAPPRTMVKSITVDGMDITDTPVAFTGDDVDGVEVVLTQRLTELSGSVTDARGGRVTDASVVIFAEDREKWVPLSRYVRTAKPDQQGQYKVQGVPPGRYLVVAVDYLEPGEETNPETLEQLRSRGTSLTIREGETRAMDLKVTAGI